MRAAVVLPALNEAPRLGPVLDHLARVVPHARLFVVDSGSRDGTAAVARAGGATLVLPEGPGYSLALQAGYRRCLAEGFQQVLLMDADGQHPASEAPRLLAALEGADLVVGSRGGTRSPAPWPRRAANLVLSGSVWAATGVRLQDVTSGFQALGPRVLPLLLRHLPPEAADANVRVLALRAGLRVVEVPVAMERRTGGVSMHDGVLGLLNLGSSLRAVARARNAPLREPAR